MGFIRKILRTMYHGSPLWLQTSISHMLVNHYVPMGSMGLTYYAVKADYWFVKALIRLSPHHQMARLRKHLAYCYENVPFYQELFDKHNIRPNDFRQVKDLERIPVLTKQDLKLNYDRLSSRRTGPHTVHMTTGTTGTPVKFLLDKRVKAMKWIVTEDILRGEGLTRADMHIDINTFAHILYGKQEKYTVNTIFKEIYFSAHANKREDMILLLKLMKRYRPRYVRSMPSFMYECAQIARQEMLCPSFNVLISDREALYPYQKKAIEGVFRCRVIDHYTCWEKTVSAVRQPGETAFAIDPFVGLVEVVDGKGMQVREGVQGRMAATGLYNRSMPLIRYDTGDVARMTERHKAEIFGRQSQIMKIRGRSFSPTYLSCVLDKFQNILQSQYAFGLDRVELRVVPFDRFSIQDLERLRKKASEVIGAPVKVRIVKEIPRGPGGKSSFCVRK